MEPKNELEPVLQSPVAELTMRLQLALEIELELKSEIETKPVILGVEARTSAAAVTLTGILNYNMNNLPALEPVKTLSNYCPHSLSVIQTEMQHFSLHAEHDPYKFC